MNDKLEDDDIEFEFDMDDDDTDVDFEFEPEKPAPPPHLFAKFGGPEAIQIVVEKFYNLVLEDEQLRPYFQDIDMNRLAKHQVDFVSFALGGPTFYSGQSLSESHKGLNIKPEHYDLTLNHLAASLLYAGVSAEDTESVMVMFRPLRASIAPTLE
ncbi:group I truncated hemoglobin [Paenibacillus psychroresistens]|nr:group 1 truncated hemoglobin [Paenibacillus psychroresistens]